MPNWCSTRYEIHFPNHEEAQAFYDKLESWCSVAHKSDFGETWLRNIVVNSGIASLPEDGTFNIEPSFECRGWIAYTDISDDTVYIDTETAWCPMHDMWKAILTKYAPDVSVTFYATEVGCGIYDTNDDSYVGKYVIDIFDKPDDIPFDSYTDDATADDIKELAKILNIEFFEDCDINELIELILNSGDISCSINEWDTSEEFNLPVTE